MLSRGIAIFVTAACATATFVHADGAHAKWARHNAHDCTTDDAYSGWGNTIDNNGPYNIDVSCALDDDYLYTKQEIETLNVHVHDGPGYASTYARVCVTYYDVLGGSCDNWAATPGNSSGNYTLQPPLGALQIVGAAGDFGYLRVLLPSGSELKGYYTHD
ncbi:MAG: hypothetical protein K0V04_31235 [Deltaproteobacteria bacterium]|nr:hypothetical protein [Deltaproteobacteria bacterium]